MNPRSAPALRWGILGPGGIARGFADALVNETTSTVAAVASRDLARAQSFADEFGGTAYGSYDDLVADDAVDVVYVATPHSHHRDHALLAINAGKPVLVEKAFTRSHTEALEVIGAARNANVFCMEAMWTRFLPHVAAIHDVIGSGQLGGIITITADHGQFFEFNADHRLYNPALAGGALLDLGVYPVAWAHDFLGAPEHIAAIGSLTETRVDGQVSMAFGYAGDAQAALTTTLWSRTATTASIAGTKGRVDVGAPFYTPRAPWSVVLRDGPTTTHEPTGERGLQYEAAEVARCLADGTLESALMTHQDTLEIMATLDELRRQVGVKFPGEMSPA